MNPGTFYSAASLLNPRAKQNKKKSANGRAVPSPAPSIQAIPSAHALLNPKRAAIKNEHDDSTAQDSQYQHAKATSSNPDHSSASGQPQFVFTNNNDQDEDDDQVDYSNSIGQAALLAKSQNLPNRTEQYAKRQKMSDANGSSWVGSHGPSEVSLHLKNKRAEGLAQDGPVPQTKPTPSNTIDLTDDADDDTIAGDAQEDNVEEESESEESEEEDPEVCIGQVDGAYITIDHIPAVPKTSKTLSSTQWPSHKILLKKLQPRDLRITAYDCEGKDFGTLAAKYAYAISQALNGKKITKLTAILMNRRKRPGERPGDPASDRIPVHILVYCKKSIGLKLYKQLAKAKAPLRTPIGTEEMLEKIKFYDVQMELYEDGGVDALAGGKVDAAALEKLEHDVFEVLNDMPEHGHLAKMEPDPEYITTPLLDYQKQGLQFMTEQEADTFEALDEKDTPTSASGAAGRSLWRVRMDNKDNFKFVNRAIGLVQEDPPYITMGGLLADQMGLGKTLTVIALIASTIDAAEDWCQSVQGEIVDGINLCNVRTTLVIAPPSVLQNWEEQLKKHTVEDSLSVLKYHGSNRLTNLDALTNYDVILTTYGTVQSEMGWRTARDKRRKSLFAHFNFYRVVLDEAHYIKAQTSDRAISIFNLHAERRWAITGTPIQNGLEDFGSILKFLRLTPFDRSFKQLVTLPAKREPEIVLGRMKLVFNSITLRRTKDKLSLPQNTKSVEKVILRNDERYLYDRFTKEVSRKINSIATEDLSRNYVTFFAQLLSCRRICDSTDLLSKKEMGFLNDSPDTSDDERRDTNTLELTEEQGYKQMDAFEGSACCSRCGNGLLKDTLDTDAVDADADDTEICRYWDCLCFICPKCSEDFEKEVEAIEKDDMFTCPFNDFTAKVKSVKLTYMRFMQHKERIQQREQENASKVARRYTKASSKTEALLKHLEEARQVGYTDGMPNKAVVFTFWSNYLDLLQIDLEKAGFRFLRLDGSVTQTKRVSLLEKFNSDPLITVLISTIGAGGVGINLQVANSVFIMEPQWNPAAEEQAVDRVHRLGQTRAVTTIRFIAHDTVEQGVRKMAQQKQALADLTTSAAKLKRSDVTAKVQELLSVLQRR